MKKKIFNAILVLIICFLIFLYISKIFFPQEFVICIENKNLIIIGNYIDHNAWLYYLCSGITAFITYWLYCCAVSHRKRLGLYNCLIILSTIVIVRIIGFYDTNISTIISWTSFIFLPAVMKGNIKSVSIVFTIHSMAQGLSLTIRNLPIYLTNINFVTTFIIGVESYLWLLLFYIIFNYKEKEI